MRPILSIFSALLAFNLCNAPATALGQEYIPEIGGSNYGIITAGSYLREKTEAAWYSSDGVKGVVGNFHRYPEVSRRQIREFAKNGQKQIVLMLWTIDSNAPVDDEFGHTIRIGPDGKIRPQHAENLKHILQEIAVNNFKRVYIRFANQGKCDPSQWSSWDEKQFQENLSFAVSVRNIVDSTLKGTNLEAFYDLAGEQPGGPGLSPDYVKRKWVAWTRLFGPSHTVGFSIAWAPGRLIQMIRDFKAVSPYLPEIYALDIYGNEYAASVQAMKELKAVGEHKKPVVIMETYHNDRTAARDFLRARRNVKLQIISIFQWPLDRDASITHFSRDFTPQYGEYMKVVNPAR